MQKELIETLDKGINLYNLVDLGDYWSSRYSLSFDYELKGNSLRIFLSEPFDKIHPDISFLIPTTASFGVEFIDADHQIRKAIVSPLDPHYNCYRFSSETYIVIPPQFTALEKATPDDPYHPCFYKDSSVLSVDPKEGEGISFDIYTVDGLLVQKGSFDFQGQTNLSDLPSGLYWARIKGEKGMSSVAFIR